MRSAHWQITIGGIFGVVQSPIENWQFALRVDADLVPTTTEPNDPALLADATAIQASFQTNMLNKLQGGVRHTYTDIRFIGNDGLQPKNPDGSYKGAVRLLTDGPAGATETPRYPFQTALCVSLNTARSGPRGRGRVFLPPPVYPLSSDGRISLANAQEFTAAFAQVIRDVNGTALDALDGPVCVMSTFGFASPVTSVRVGRSLDTHRSRRADLPEGYSANVLVA